MSNLPGRPLPEIPDLLRRFVATPFEARFQSGGAHWQVKTNEARLLEILRNRLEPAGHWHGEASWTMVSDPKLPAALREPMTMESGATTFISFGRGCAIAIDGEKKEITGFVSAAVSEREWSELIWPALQEAIAEIP